MVNVPHTEARFSKSELAPWDVGCTTFMLVSLIFVADLSVFQ